MKLFYSFSRSGCMGGTGRHAASISMKIKKNNSKKDCGVGVGGGGVGVGACGAVSGIPSSFTLTKNQEKYIELLNNDKISVLVVVGPAGTGKTMLASKHAVSNIYGSMKYKKIIISRPTVTVSNENLGFMPGDINDKMKPWLIPFYDSFVELNGGGSVGGGLTHNDFLKKVFIETVPFAFMRGRTFHDSFILCDEMQNSTPEQMLMLLTRIGKCSKMVITGDLKQSDLNCYNNGLRDFVDKLFFMKNKILALKKNCGGGDEVGADTMTFTIKNVAFIRLSQDDIKRCDTVNFILDIYKYAR